jgi:hypothetical protein
MLELLVIVLMLVGLVVGPALLLLAPWHFTFATGVLLMAFGVVVGLPAAAYYHFRLWRALRPGRLWWLNPTALHGQLSAADRPPVMRWFRVGAFMFGVILLGCLVTAAGAARSR